MSVARSSAGKLSAGLYRAANAWTLLAAIALYGFFLASVMPQQARDSQAYADDWGAPDRHLFYTPDKLYQHVPDWPAAGRQDYIQFRLGWDIGWAFTYTLFLVSATGLALRRAFPAGHPQRRLILAALVPGLLDLAENAVGIVLVANADTRLDGLAWFAASLTATKWVTLALAHAILVYAIGTALWRILGERRSEAHVALGALRHLAADTRMLGTRELVQQAHRIVTGLRGPVGEDAFGVAGFGRDVRDAEPARTDQPGQQLGRQIGRVTGSRGEGARKALS